MKLYDAGISFLLVVAAIALIAGYTGVYLAQEDDAPVEEMAESVLEDTAEKVLGLDEDTLKDTIDLTPSSDED